jgi:hypothetical protein
LCLSKFKCDYFSNGESGKEVFPKRKEISFFLGKIMLCAERRPRRDEDASGKSKRADGIADRDIKEERADGVQPSKRVHRGADQGIV